MKNTVLFFASIVLTIFTSCSQTNLSNDEARYLITTTLKLPVSYRHDVNKRPSIGSGFELDGLRNAGLITGSEYFDSRRLIEIQITEIGEPSFMGENNSSYMFKTNDIDFNQINGISINKEEQTATVRFSIKATNITLAAYALAKTNAGFSGKKIINYSLINPLKGELVFKKFDNGWQLLDQSKSNSDLLNQILDSDSNSNGQDDYSQLIKEKRDEIYAKANASQAHFSDIQEFFVAFKKAVLTKDMNEIAKFVHFPLQFDSGGINKNDFKSGSSFIHLSYFDIVTETNSLQKYGENDYGIPETSMKFTKHEDGFWKLDQAYGSPDFDR